MERIIAGRFQTKGEADDVAALIAQYVDTADICIFHNNPPGQHDAYAVGGDEDEDPGAKGAAEIEQANGKWRDGDWADFDPVTAPRLVTSASH